jgi:hypothetical protein
LVVAVASAPASERCGKSEGWRRFRYKKIVKEEVLWYWEARSVTPAEGDTNDKQLEPFHQYLDAVGYLLVMFKPQQESHESQVPKPPPDVGPLRPKLWQGMSS